jgi:uncharacterized membrane protein YdjX (TVP38/TMEM64 family)
MTGVFVLWASHSGEIFTWARLAALRGKGFVAQHPAGSFAAYLAFAALVINCPVPVAGLLKVLAGFLFGVAAGTALNVAMSVAGGLLGFWASRRLLYRPLYARHAARLARANLEIARGAFWYVLSSRLFMAAPFFLVNVLCGLSSMKKRKFLMGTFVGTIPTSLVYALSGSQLEEAASSSGLADPRLAAVMALLAALAVIPAVVRHRRTRRA